MLLIYHVIIKLLDLYFFSSLDTLRTKCTRKNEDFFSKKQILNSEEW